MSTQTMFKPLTQGDIQQMLSIRPRTVRAWVTQGLLPRPTYLGRKPYWLLADVERCLRKHFKQPSKPPHNGGAVKRAKKLRATATAAEE